MKWGWGYLTFLFLTSLILPSPATAGHSTATWLGGAGSWTTPGNWNPQVDPDNTPTDTYDVLIDGGQAGVSTVSLTAAGTSLVRTVDALTIDSNDTLALTGTSLATANLVTLQGSTINGHLNLSFGSLDAGPNGNLGGSGTISIASGQLLSTTNALALGPALTIRTMNAATIGASNQPLVSHSTILCTSGGAGLGGSDFLNDGMISVSPGASLGISGNLNSFSNLGTIQNSGTASLRGTVENDNTTYTLTPALGNFYFSADIHGGTINSSGGAKFQVGPSGAQATRLNGTWLEAPTVIRDGSLYAGSDGVLHGNASLQMIHFSSFPSIRSSGTSLTLDSGISVHGSGWVRCDVGPVINKGRITADAFLEVLSQGIINLGTMEQSQAAS